MTTGQLRAIVTANRLGLAACGDDLIEHPGHAPAGEASVHCEPQTLPRVDIDHNQHANHAACGKYIVRKVQGPLLVGAAQYRPRRSDAYAVADASSASGTNPPRGTPATAVYGSLARPHVPTAPAISDSHNAASLWPVSPASLAATHPIAATDTDNCSRQSTSARTPGARWLRTAIATSSHPSSGKLTR